MPQIVQQPSLPATPAAAATPADATSLPLQPGTVVTAQIVAALDAARVRIAIAGLTLDVSTTVALQPGTRVQLAVAQVGDVTTLTPVSARASLLQGAVETGVNAQPSLADPAAASLRNAPPSADTTASSAAPAARVDPAGLTPAEREAVTIAALGAAGRQTSLAPLFADAAVAVKSPQTTPQVKAAVEALFALRPTLDGRATPAQLATAIQRFAPPASQMASPPIQQPVAAALAVLRAALATWQSALPDQGTLDVVGAAVQSAPGATDATSAARLASAQEAPQTSARPGTPPSAALPDIDPSAKTSAGAAHAEASTKSGTASTADAARVQLPPGDPKALKVGITSVVLDAIVDTDKALQSNAPASREAARASTRDTLTFATVPPPIRGALPVGQGIVAPSVTADAEPAQSARQLIEATDGAIARATLLQIASLPEPRPSAAAADQAQGRWTFEIPFATQQGTAIAQFDIAREGGGRDVEGAAKVWRARFSVNLEPSGPIHALVSLRGETTSVRMWAERTDTASRLRATMPELSAALRRAAILPGDIVVSDGSPPQPTPPTPGRFLDRAS